MNWAEKGSVLRFALIVADLFCLGSKLCLQPEYSRCVDGHFPCGAQQMHTQAIEGKSP